MADTQTMPDIYLAEEEKGLTQKFLQFTDLYIERAELAKFYIQQEMNTIEVLKTETEVFAEAAKILAGKSHTEDLLPLVVQSEPPPINQSIRNLEQYNAELQKEVHLAMYLTQAADEILKEKESPPTDVEALSRGVWEARARVIALKQTSQETENYLDLIKFSLPF